MGRDEAAGGRSACLVISHYNAWPATQLLALLEQAKSLDAGMPFQIRVVVNMAVDQRLELPPRFHDVQILHRPNEGYNIGAWDLGWQAEPRFDHYLFVQEECQLLRPGWMKAFVALTAKPDVGLVGESLVWERPWPELEATLRRPLNSQFQIDGRPVDHFECYYENLRRLGIDRGEDGRHLQSLVYASRREVLDRIGPFPTGTDYGAAVTTEICISKKVLALGLQVRQVAWLPFTYVLHPQWRSPVWRRVFGRTLMRWIPSGFRTRLLLAVRRFRPNL